MTQQFRSNAPSEKYFAVCGAYSLNWQISDGMKFLQDVKVLPKP